MRVHLPAGGASQESALSSARDVSLMQRRSRKEGKEGTRRGGGGVQRGPARFPRRTAVCLTVFHISTNMMAAHLN